MTLPSVFTATALLLYSLLFALLTPVLGLLRGLAWISPRLKTQLEGRDDVATLATRLAEARRQYQHCVVFFCSSAGEFEQARPLIQRLGNLPSVYVQVLLFSRSGLNFLRARGETVPACLTPLSDATWHWGWLLSALRPNLVCVVRHELWPGFLATARGFAPLFLIDASRSLGETSSARKRWFRSRLLRPFTHIFAVSTADSAYFCSAYGVADSKISVVSDTKYDSVRERAAAKAPAVARLRAQLAAATTGRQPAGRAPLRLVLGSAYREDVELLYGALKLRGSAAAAWQILIAPHHVDAATLADLARLSAQAGLPIRRFSQLAPGRQPPEPENPPDRPPLPDVIIIDSMGILSEIYGTALAAWVGGALHAQIHNVLEPACHGLALAFGPFYKNSQEAVLLVERGLATVTSTPQAMADWLQLLEREGPALGDRMVAEVAGLAGASDRIMHEWLPLLRPGPGGD